MKNLLILAVLASICVETGCLSPFREVQTTQKGKTAMSLSDSCWVSAFDERLPYLGHRNWILVVDKAYPAQSGNGIEVINTGKSMAEVLGKVTQALQEAPHVTPIYYTDKELEFIPESLMPGVDNYRKTLKKILKGHDTHSILHNDVFPKIDHAAKLFKVLILKTDETIAYSSVFIELDCAYWSQEKEKKLREIMRK